MKLFFSLRLLSILYISLMLHETIHFILKLLLFLIIRIFFLSYAILYVNNNNNNNKNKSSHSYFGDDCLSLSMSVLKADTGMSFFYNEKILQCHRRSRWLWHEKRARTSLDFYR